MVTQYADLWLMPCGPIPPNAADLLASGRFKEILTEASQYFDFIIVDGPPVLGLADSPALAAFCSGTLVVVEAGLTRTPAIRAAISRLNESNAHVVGVLLTKSVERAGQYSYGYGSSQYGPEKGDQRLLILPDQVEAPAEEDEEGARHLSLH